MARAGTFPEDTYFEDLTPMCSNHGTNTNEESVEEELNNGENDTEESEDKILEYETESDFAATPGEKNDEAHVDSVTNVATLLAGTCSRFGKSLKLNNKYID